MDIRFSAQQMLMNYPLCNYCLGRQFALLGYGLTNRERGEAIKTLLALEKEIFDDENSLSRTSKACISLENAWVISDSVRKGTAKEKNCYLCHGTFEDIPSLVLKASKKLKGYDFDTLLVGIELPYSAAEREDEFKAEFGVVYGESMRSQFSRDIGKQLSQKVGKQVNYSKPELVILIDPFRDQIHLQINPLFIAGQYRKLVRGISQSRWICRKCDGKGCENCKWTGKTYQYSVEELIGTPLLSLTQGEEMAFHGAGREDVDVRMLGLGRPFVIEIKNSKKRFIDLEKLETAINEGSGGKIEVRNLRFVDKSIVRKFKSKESVEKTYAATIEFGREVTDEDMQIIKATFSQSLVQQRTPTRVLHRRSDLMREKYIYEAITKKVAYNRAEIQIRCQGGLYIKELITGDEGRTRPSIASILNTDATPLQLDVLQVGEQ
jgi:tRNA pseudouridine synthase 10